MNTLADAKAASAALGRARNIVTVGRGICCSPRHPTHVNPCLFQFRGTRTRVGVGGNSDCHITWHLVTQRAISAGPFLTSMTPDPALAEQIPPDSEPGATTEDLAERGAAAVRRYGQADIPRTSWDGISLKKRGFRSSRCWRDEMTWRATSS